MVAREPRPGRILVPDFFPQRRLLRAVSAAAQDHGKVGRRGSVPDGSPCRDACHPEPGVSPTLHAVEGLERLGSPLDHGRDRIQLAGGLDAWQQAGDERLWRLIVSPENASRLELREHTRRLMRALKDEFGTKLKWVAVDPQNAWHQHLDGTPRACTDGVTDLASSERTFGPGRPFAGAQTLATPALGLRTTHALLSSSLQARKTKTGGSRSNLESVAAREASALPPETRLASGSLPRAQQ